MTALLDAFYSDSYFSTQGCVVVSISYLYKRYVYFFRAKSLSFVNISVKILIRKQRNR